MRREDLLLRYFARNSIRQDLSAEICRTISPDLDWAYFLKQANAQGLTPLVYQGLSEIACLQPPVPQGIWKKLERCYYSVAGRNALLCERLADILQCQRLKNIEIIVLKGMGLIHTVYSNIALRPIYDIDILIHKEEFPLVQSTLKELGYANSVYYPEDFYQDGIMLDVHGELLNETRISSRQKSHALNMQELWERAVPIEINGQKAKILSPEHNLMALCLHLTIHHGLQGLIWFVDIAKFIDYYKDGFNWDRFIDGCLNYKISKPVYYALFCTQKFLGQDIPNYILDSLRPNRRGLLERKIFELISSGTYLLENAGFIFALSNIENYGDRLKFLREISLPSPGLLRSKNNASSLIKLPIYYLRHFYSLVLAGLQLLKKVSINFFAISFILISIVPGLPAGGIFSGHI
jgi:hypothetical protein